MIRKLLSSAASLVIFSITLCAQQDAESLHKLLADQLKSAGSIKVTALAKQLDNTRVKIKAKRGDKFSIELPQRKIICDGKTVWNYTPQSKNVVISTYNPQTKALSVEKLLLEIVAEYKPVALKSENSSGAKPVYVLSLQPQGSPLYGVKSIKLKVDKKRLQIIHISVGTEQGNQEWAIESLDLNANLSDSQFVFKAAKDVEVVDMRD